MNDSLQQNDVVAPVPPVNGGVHLRGWALVGVLAGLILTLLLAALDQTIVGTALPHIIGDLHGFDRYSWVMIAYLCAAIIVITLFLKDVRLRKRGEGIPIDTSQPAASPLRLESARLGWHNVALSGTSGGSLGQSMGQQLYDCASPN